MPRDERIIMVGTKDFAVPTFEALLDRGFNVVALVTQPERPQGRKQELVASTIKRVALERGIPVEQPENINDPAALDRVRALEPAILVTAAYGQILSRDLLQIPPFGGLNLHGSLLPAYRGAAPVARAIQHGETRTGVTVIQMTPQVDAGGMLATAITDIDPDETAGELEARLAQLGAPLMVETLERVFAREALSLPQNRARVSRAAKLTREDGLIRWNRPAHEIHNLVRAMQPWPTAFATWRWNDERAPLRLIVHKTMVAQGEATPGAVIAAGKGELIVGANPGAVRLLIVQPPGKKPMSTEEFLRGYRLEGNGQFVDTAL